MKKNLENIKSFFERKNVLELLLILSSVMTVNFMAYFIRYDINALTIVDSTTIAKHIFHVIILYTIISALVYILFTFLKVKNLLEIFFKKGFSFNKKLAMFFIKHMISILIFMFFYVGFINALLIVIATSIYLFIRIYTIKKSEKKDKKVIQSLNSSETLAGARLPYFSFIFMGPIGIIGEILFSLVKYFINESQRSLEISKTENILRVLTTELGVLLLSLALLSGLARADYVEKSILVNLNQEKEILVLYMTTNNGVGLYNRELKEVSFSSWDSIKNLTFLKRGK